MGSLGSELNKAKLALAATDQLKAYLVVAKKARDADYVAATQVQSEVVIVGAQRDKAL